MEPNEEVEVEEIPELPDVEEGAEDPTDWKSEAQKLREKAISQRERTKALKKELADAKNAVGVVASSKKAPTTDALDETALDFLDVKGITEAEDIQVIEQVTKKTGMTVRQALKDDYVVKKLEANRASREVKDATPSSTRRSGTGETNDLALAIARYEQSGYKELPSDFKLRSAVVNAVAEKNDTNKPSWR